MGENQLVLRKLKVIYGLLIGAAVIVNSYIPFVVNKPHALQAIFLVNVLYATVYILLNKKYYGIARILFIVTPSISTLLVGHLTYSGTNMIFGSKFTILSTLILPLLIVDIRERFFMLSSLLTVTICFLSFEWVGSHFIFPVNHPTMDAPDYLITITALFDVAIFIFGFVYTQSLTIKSENRVFTLLQRERELRREIVEGKKKDIDRVVNSFKMKFLSNQMNPHFIFNAINSVQYHIMRLEKKKAYDYLSKFAHLIRKILENTQKDKVSLSEEKDMLLLYLDLEKTRFKDRFAYQVVVDPTIDPAKISIPSMLIQPYVENSLKHGILHKKGKGELLLEIQREGDFLKCIIEDNGIGRKEAEKIKSEKNKTNKSLGMSITAERLSILNTMEDARISVNVTDLYDALNNEALGTRVEIRIPISY